jgi:hypothetical protein
MTPVDRIFTRVGASDRILAGTMCACAITARQACVAMQDNQRSTWSWRKRQPS